MRAVTIRPAVMLVAALLASLLASPAPAHAQASALQTDQLKNMSYPSEFAAGGSATLRDGVYDQRAVLGPTAPRAVVRFIASVSGADFAGVVLASDPGGSGTFVTLHLVRAERGAATAGPGLLLGDRTRVNSIALSPAGTVLLDLTTHARTDPLCCPSLQERREYAPAGNGFRLLSAAQADRPAAPAASPIAPRTGNLGKTDTDQLDVAAALALAAVLAAATRGTTRAPRHP